MVVYHSTVAAHQTCAILCLSLLKELSEKLGEGVGKRERVSVMVRERGGGRERW